MDWIAKFLLMGRVRSQSSVVSDTLPGCCSKETCLRAGETVARKVRVGMALAVWGSLSAMASPAPFPPAPERIPGATTYIYKEVGPFKLPLYVFQPTDPAGKPAPISPKKRAAVLYFHGSGWESGTVLQYAGHARLLASHGVTTAVVEYRIKTPYGATPFESVADAKSAIRWMRAHAEEFGVDPRKIVAAGGSAGAHIALAAAVFADTFDEPADERALSPRPDALLLMAPIVDTTETGYKEGVPLFGGRAEELSPVHHLRAGLPPALVLLGTADQWISLESVERFRQRAASLGAVCEVVLFEGRSHHFYNHPDYFELRPNLKKQDTRTDFVPSFYVMERFLFEQGFVAESPRVVFLP